ncbi:hypothetical protein EDC01DRAFT_630654 [Geopyxis carbonaria]|nr:hypothetical protein EDC01DRAFT_630654 [Geopyxis carbonaria]
MDVFTDDLQDAARIAIANIQTCLQLFNIPATTFAHSDRTDASVPPKIYSDNNGDPEHVAADAGMGHGSPCDDDCYSVSREETYQSERTGSILSHDGISDTRADDYAGSNSVLSDDQLKIHNDIELNDIKNSLLRSHRQLDRRIACFETRFRQYNAMYAEKVRKKKRNRKFAYTRVQNEKISILHATAIMYKKRLNKMRLEMSALKSDMRAVGL